LKQNKQSDVCLVLSDDTTQFFLQCTVIVSAYLILIAALIDLRKTKFDGSGRNRVGLTKFWDIYVQK